MCFDPTGRSIALAVSLVVLTIVSALAADDTSNQYSSPTAVFNAYRQAGAKGDWRKLFSCYTPRVQDGVVCESLFGSAERNSEEDLAILKKYVDLAGINEEYKSKYKAKHGVDLAKLVAEHEHEHDPKFKPPARDDELWVHAVVAHIKDKVGFVEAVAKVSEVKLYPKGDLDGLLVRGDTASGHAKETILPDVEHGERPLKPGESPAVYDRHYTFRRIKGSWLIDSL